jgi:hypothetical protein
LLSGNLDLSVNLDQILSDLGLTSGGPLTLNQLLTDFGVSTTDNVLPPLTVGDALNLLGFSDTSPIPIPPITVTLGEVFSLFGVDPSAQFTVVTLPIVGAVRVTLNQVLSALGLSTGSSTTITPPPITFGEVLSALGVSDNTTIPIPPLSIEDILNTLGINPNEDIFTLLGISNPLTLTPTIDLTGGPVPNFELALSQDLMAVLGGFAHLSSIVPSLLTPDPTLDVAPLLSSLVSDLGLGATITGGTLTADLTNIAAELLPNLVP